MISNTFYYKDLLRTSRLGRIFYLLMQGVLAAHPTILYLNKK